MARLLMVIGCGILVTATAFQARGQQAQSAEDEVEPKYTIAEVMEGAHKSKLLQKVLKDEASQEETIELLDHYVSLTESEPPKGSPEDWQGKADAIVVAAAKVLVKRSQGKELLQKATNCKACHQEHKP